MLASEYERFDGLALGELLRKGEVTPSELMRVAIELAQQRAPSLNALCYEKFEESLELSKKADLKGIFGGVPFLLKDSGLASTRFPSSIGSKLFSNSTFNFDAELTKRFDAAGFISFARTTVPEFCMAPTTEATQNGGPTRNPWDLTRSAGGSSGGAAAAVAAGIVPVAHGSDGGGSIRIPASCCGLFGLKPSRGLVPIGPSRGEAWGGLAADGVLSRTVRDTAAALDAIVGADPGAPYAAPTTPVSFLKNLGTPFDRPLRIAKWISPWGNTSVDPECLAAVAIAEQLLRDNGHEVIEVGAPDINYDSFISGHMDVLATSVTVSAGGLTRNKAYDEWKDKLEPAMLDAFNYGKTLSAQDYVLAINRFHKISRIMESFMKGFDLVLTPTLTTLPVKIGTLTMDADFKSFRRRVAEYTTFLAVINASGQPAASIPLHSTKDGLPIGVQLIGHFGAEDTILRAAAQLETSAPWIDRRPGNYIAG